MKVTIRQKSGMQYLFADINVSGLRTKCTLGISVKEGKYNPKIQGVEGEADCETNVLINKFKSGIMEMIRMLQQSGKLSVQEINDGVQKIRQQLTDPNFDIDDKTNFCKYIKQHIERSKVTRKEATIKQYNNCLSKLEQYERLHKVKLTFAKIDYDFYSSFLAFSMQKLQLSTNSIGKLIKNVKMWMTCATDEGLNTNMIYSTRSFKKPEEDAETIYLSEQELTQIKNTILPNKHLEHTKDVFLLACYTGVRFQDYHKLNTGNLINNGTMFKVRTEKTDEEVIIPLHPEAKRIMEKHNGSLVQISNQKFNEYLKKVCEIAGINESISITRTTAGKKKTTTLPKHEFVSSHTARRSFATNAYKAGVASLAIMAITGHRTEKVFLKYIRVTKEEHATIAGKHLFFQGKVA